MANITDQISVINTPLALVLLANTTTSQTMVGNRFYIGDSSSLITFTLPSSIAFGEILTIINRSSGGWKIAQRNSQSIKFGDQTTTSGTSGYLASTVEGDTVTIICTTQDTGFQVINSIGNITIN